MKLVEDQIGFSRRGSNEVFQNKIVGVGNLFLTPPSIPTPLSNPTSINRGASKRVNLLIHSFQFNLQDFFS
jgi:hypothetical protein